MKWRAVCVNSARTVPWGVWGANPTSTRVVLLWLVAFCHFNYTTFRGTMLYFFCCASPFFRALYLFPMWEVWVNHNYHVTTDIHFTGKSVEPAKAMEVARFLWEQPSIIDDYINENIFPLEEMDILSNWKHCISGRFIIERHLKKRFDFHIDRGWKRLPCQRYYWQLGRYVIWRSNADHRRCCITPLQRLHYYRWAGVSYTCPLRRKLYPLIQRSLHDRQT